MSNAKFASITSRILARKGEARPWADPDSVPPPWNVSTSSLLPGLPPANGSENPQGLARTPARKASVRKAAEPSKAKKSAVRMSLDDYERLGIIAVKKGSTRQHLLQEALERLLAEESHKYEKECTCLRSGAQRCETACSG